MSSLHQAHEHNRPMWQCAGCGWTAWHFSLETQVRKERRSGSIIKTLTRTRKTRNDQPSITCRDGWGWKYFDWACKGKSTLRCEVVLVNCRPCWLTSNSEFRIRLPWIRVSDDHLGLATEVGLLSIWNMFANVFWLHQIWPYCVCPETLTLEHWKHMWWYYNKNKTVTGLQEWE